MSDRLLLEFHFTERERVAIRWGEDADLPAAPIPPVARLPDVPVLVALVGQDGLPAEVFERPPDEVGAFLPPPPPSTPPPPSLPR